MIAFIAPLPIGNAIRVLLSPPSGAEKMRLLRKTADNFTGHDDADAAVVYEGMNSSALDTTALINGAAYFYKVYDFDGAVWSTSPSVPATPDTDYGIFGADVLTLVRDRLFLGLKAAVAAGVVSHKNGSVPCLTAPPLYENTVWPVVSLHLNNDAPEVRGIGELIQSDVINDDDGIDESEGWISRVSLQIVVWALNPDERIALRKAVKSVIIGNLPVFDDAGVVNVEMSQSDVDDFESYSAPVYQTISSFTCLAPSVVQSSVDVIGDVTLTQAA
ncbi:hypothetical protein [Parvibaculum sp.]|uniref:hypothetical protein n=1 Tax=Parvibaculum sp. TaxID=2024848 RepID=UPI00273331F6|nr:hypothetical protein [Parvibaculum sp.]MDP3327201.1 hypothetical protein [Parvibaculum sp.]